MRRMGWAATAAATAAVAIGGARVMGADGQDDERGRSKRCSEATVRGDYGIQIQGTRPAPGGLTESVIGIVFRTYDGQGNFSQVSNLKGSIAGANPDSQGFGTYEVNHDCTGVIRFQAPSGALIEERLVVVDNGREIRRGGHGAHGGGDHQCPPTDPPALTHHVMSRRDIDGGAPVNVNRHWVSCPFTDTASTRHP